MLPSAEDLTGREIGGYRLARVLGRGATGIVFLGERDEGEHTQVAIKVLILPPQLSAREQAEFHARFRREAQTLLELHHSHVLAVLGFGEDGATGLSYIILPYVESTLERRMATAGGRLPLEEVAAYAMQLAEALDYAHRHGVIHRDVKPANVLLDDRGHVYLTDFSIAHLFDLTHTTLTGTGRVLGTPSYMAPEQFRGGRVGPAADVYSLGVLLYQLVAGRTPFEGSSLYELVQRVTTEAPPPPRHFRPDLPEPAEAALLRALAKQPGHRFPNAQALAQAFAHGLQGQWVEGLRPQAIFGTNSRTQADTSGAVASAARSIPTRPLHPPRGWARVSPTSQLVLLLSALGAAILVLVVGGLMLLLSTQVPGWVAQLSPQIPLFAAPTHTASATATPQPTATAIPTETPVFSYSAAVPGPGCGSTDWSASAQSQPNIQCTSAGLLMTHPANADTLAEVYWDGVGSPASYSAAVTVSNLTTACGGIGFQDGYRSYIGYVCANGGWGVYRYDSTGSPTRLDTGSVAQQGSYLIEIIVTDNSTVQFHIGATTVFSDSIASGYDTRAITLALFHYSAGQSGQGYFSRFIYGRD